MAMITQVMILWIVMSCSDVMDTKVSENHTASIIILKIPQHEKSCYIHSYI